MNVLEACSLSKHRASVNLGHRQSDVSICAIVLASTLLLLSPWVTAAPAFQTQATAVTGGTDVQTLTIPVPAGTSSGDLLLATISTDSDETLDTPLGWTVIDQGSSGGAVTVAAYYRIATATEPASYTFTWGSIEQAAGAILRYSGVSTSNPVDAFGVATGTSASPTSPSVATLSADTRVVRIYGADDDDLATNPYPTGTTGRLNVESSGGGGSSSLGVADSTQLAIAATGTAAFATSASEQWRALTVVLAPPGVNPLPLNDSNNAPAVCSAAAADGGGSISGVVNRYYPGATSVSAGATSISLGASIGAGAAISAGDTLLVIQMQDAVIDTSNNANYGDSAARATADGSGSSDIRQTGLYEFVVATNSVVTTGGTVNLASALAHTYNRGTNRRFQVVRVPRYGNVTLGGTLTATPWNGLAGGVLTMSVQGTLNLGGNTIDVSGQGFRGALYNGSTATSSGDASTDYVVATGTRWGAKGEGIAGGPSVGPTPMANTDGYPGGSLARGAPGNAGGGGNDHNAGGGGGSNIGSGGRGGFPYPTGTVGGKGGAAFAGYPGRLLAGGGGGAGHKNNAGGTGAGGNGGGIVFISATTITASGFIRANGSAGDFSVQDGAGGGGAGGSILIRTASSSVAGLTLSARGGNGGDSYYPDNHGPGGGGGGGAIYVGATGASTDIAGGAPGFRRNNGPTDPAVTTHGALAGHRGQVVTPSTVPAPAPVPVPVACDYGDAPSAYSTATTLHSVGGTGGGSPNLRLGSVVDFEWQGDASSNALADNLRDTSGTGAGSDEDGVAFNAPAGGGDNIIATVTVSNTTGASANLCGWMDVNVNNVFEASERRCTSVPSGGTTNVLYEWLLSSTVTQIYVSRFRVCSVASQCNVPTGQALNGEMEDYSLSYTPTLVTIGKVALAAIPLSTLLSELVQQDDHSSSALALLAFYDSALAASLQDETGSAIAQALTDYMDPDGDGQVATLRWDTLEERGTIGFYVERRAYGQDNWQRVNGDLLPGLITAPMGGEYWLADPGALPGQSYEYQLIEMEARGQLRTYGPWTLSLEK
jgi:GEVED domain